MSKSTGKDGNFAMTGFFSEQDGHITLFTCEVQRPLFPANDFADATDGQIDIPGMHACFVEFEGFLDSSVAPFATTSYASNGAESTMTLTCTTGETISVSGHMESFAVGVNKQTGINTVRGRLKGRVTGTATA